MSDYDRNLRGPRLNDTGPVEPGLDPTVTDPVYRNRSAMNSPGSWIGGVVVAILIILGIAYLFSGSTANNGTTEHRASATDKAVGPAPAITASPAPLPSGQPKP